MSPERVELLGVILGTQQAYEHLRLPGAPSLHGQPLARLAQLAWKYEARAKVGDDRLMRRFLEAYTSSYASTMQGGA